MDDCRCLVGEFGRRVGTVKTGEEVHYREERPGTPNPDIENPICKNLMTLYAPMLLSAINPMIDRIHA